MPNSQSESPPKFPLTLAEVLFEELTTQDLAAAEKIDRQIKTTRMGNPDSQSWYRDAELRDWQLKKKSDDEIVPMLYGAIRTLKRSALCLSGGGVRSATFNLGILQGLARSGLLAKFDYLSTVSGGGFIGSWLTAWIYRAGQACHREHAENRDPTQGLKEVISELNRRPPALAPEPKPLYNLRVYANYLTPKKGLMSADSWTLIAIYLRNLFLNWCVFIPGIMAFLLLPRIWLAFVKSPRLTPETCLIIGFVSGVIALGYISLGLPSSRARLFNLSDSWFVCGCLLPLVVTAMALTAYWARLKSAGIPTTLDFIRFGALMAVLPGILIIIAHILATRDERREALAAGRQLQLARKLMLNLIALFLIVVAFALSSFLVACIVSAKPFHPPLNLAQGNGRLYAALAVPALLIILSGGGTLIAGFTSYFTEVDDQEWWARVGAWMLIVAVGWSGLHLLVLAGPRLFVEAHALILKQTWSWASLKGVATTVIGIVSGAISLLGGYSAKTPAQGSEEKGEQPRSSMLAAAVLPVSAAIFAAFIVLVLAQITNWLLVSAPGAMLNSLANWISGQSSSLGLDLSNPRELVYHTPGLVLVLMGIVLIALGALLGLLINTNKFSLHYYWRNRMMRAYLGATRNPEDRERTRNRFTDFDNSDNLRMHQLKQKPLHVVNVTLNLAGGKKLAWQDRKAESFTMSPLHCGSYWLGYRDSKDYALNRDNEGISLATAVAISGAAASPNMGYMMTSPVLRFIMTLFNIRLGFWLGNPGPDGGATFHLDSPRESVRPIVEEALGMTDDTNPYVYLSDGGHFENFGLYEMILRRCRFVVVSDASTDTNYAYESLAMAIRQIRVDFGVPIDMGPMQFGSYPDAAHNYCALGLIKYSCVDRAGGGSDAKEDANYDGVLVYVKPSLIGDEPRDVLNYHASSPTFPEETIADQWFSESQFESYRALGSHMVERMCGKTASDSQGKPDHVELGARISSKSETGSQEFSIKGWMEKLRPTSAPENEADDLDQRIKAVISTLVPEGGTLADLSCGDFAKFATEAQGHITRTRK